MSLFSGVTGLTLIAEVKLTFNAPRWGRGEIERADLSTGVTSSESFGVLTSSVSSSELLNRRRLLLWREGDVDFFGGGMADSPSMERGLYLGRPEPTRELRLRTEDRALMEPFGLALSDGDDDGSSGGGASFLSADCLRE